MVSSLTSCTPVRKTLTTVLDSVARMIHPVLKKGDFFPESLRPLYYSLLTTVNPQGKEWVINGCDKIVLTSTLRNVSAVHEPDVWHRLMDEVRPGDTVLDIGASVGLYTLGFVRRLLGRGRVFSFEPDFASYQLFMENLALNDPAGLVCPIHCAVGETNGVLRFVSGHGPTSHAAGPTEDKYVSVACLTLDGIFEGTDALPAVLKIDVEGMEEQVLRGAKSLLDGGLSSRKEKPRLLYIDMHPWAWKNLGLSTTERSLTDFLHACGYEVHRRNDEFADIYAMPR
jgi:FkbM family methyltransferase